MQLTLTRDESKGMPVASDPEIVTNLTIWHCKYRSLAELAKYTQLRKLSIAGFPDGSLEVLETLKHLEWLSILHLPKVTSLSPLGNVLGLRCLSLATLPSWDASSKRSIVESLKPLAHLEQLAHLALLGITTPSKSLTDLEHCKGLKTARFHGYPKREVARFQAATGIRNDFPPSYSGLTDPIIKDAYELPNPPLKRAPVSGAA